MNPRPLNARNQRLLDWYSYCQLSMTPQSFYAKWQVSQEDIAAICSRSVSTVRRWFGQGESYRRPSAIDLRHLALADFLLDHFDELPEELQQALCPMHEIDADD
ncbi:MAG: helix-turn-helix domain-containing protein [Cyanobacteria bacterium P01_F01_bin.150]